MTFEDDVLEWGKIVQTVGELIKRNTHKSM
jgi:hypothetical protein